MKILIEVNTEQLARVMGRRRADIEQDLPHVIGQALMLLSEACDVKISLVLDEPETQE